MLLLHLQVARLTIAKSAGFTVEVIIPIKPRDFRLCLIHFTGVKAIMASVNAYFLIATRLTSSTIMFFSRVISPAFHGLVIHLTFDRWSFVHQLNVHEVLRCKILNCRVDFRNEVVSRTGETLLAAVVQAATSCFPVFARYLSACMFACVVAFGTCDGALAE